MKCVIQLLSPFLTFGIFKKSNPKIFYLIGKKQKALTFFSVVCLVMVFKKLLKISYSHPSTPVLTCSEIWTVNGKGYSVYLSKELCNKYSRMYSFWTKKFQNSVHTLGVPKLNPLSVNLPKGTEENFGASS